MTVGRSIGPWWERVTTEKERREPKPRASIFEEISQLIGICEGSHNAILRNCESPLKFDRNSDRNLAPIGSLSSDDIDMVTNHRCSFLAQHFPHRIGFNLRSFPRNIG
jgi:hypothetical protein